MVDYPIRKISKKGNITFRNVSNEESDIFNYSCIRGELSPRVVCTLDAMKECDKSS